MGEPALKFRGCDYMPIKLKGVLVERGISQPKLAAAIKQMNGQPMSATAMSFLINRSYYPKNTDEAEIRRQIEEFLRLEGVPESVIGTIWHWIEDKDEYRNRNPRGSNLSIVRPSRIKPEVPATLFEPMEVEMLSPAAKRHFKLFRDPFSDDVNGPDDVFLSAEQRYIGEAMFQTAKHGGFLAVVGESGSGKSTLRKMLVERIRDQPIRMIYPQVLDKTRLSTGAICQAVINDLTPGQTVRSSLEGQARQVRDILLASRTDNTHVLVIEEAHDITITTLKYLKRFYELEDGFRKLLSIVLIGQPELKDKLDEKRHPEAREVIKRIELAELMPLNSHLEEYLAHKFQRVGIALDAIFAADAFEQIRRRWITLGPDKKPVSQLYPLTVNNTVTKAMNRAAILGVPLITADLVKEI